MMVPPEDMWFQPWREYVAQPRASSVRGRGGHSSSSRGKGGRNGRSGNEKVYRERKDSTDGANKNGLGAVNNNGSGED